MKNKNSELWTRARKVRDKLADQLLGHPEVSLIDIGYDTDPGLVDPYKHIVIRVHVKRPAAKVSVEVPAEIDGIPVQVIIAGYKLE